MRPARLASVVLFVLGLACNSTGSGGNPPGSGGSDPGAGGSGGSTPTGGTGGPSGGSGGTAGRGGSGGGGAGGAGGAGGGGGGGAGGGGGGGAGGGADAAVDRAGDAAVARDMGGTGGMGGMPGATCAQPYTDAEKSCHATCTRCTGGDPIIDKIYGLTPPDGKMKLSQDYNLDAERSDPDSTPALVKSAIYGLKGAVYWVADMDIDCDGKETPGKCDRAHDCCFMMDTAVHGPNGALTSAVTPYVVIPNNFHAAGLNPGTVVAIIYGGKVGFAIFGDTGPANIIGEASYASAEMMGVPPSAVDGGINGRSVTYIAFTGTGTVPKNVEDKAETRALGQMLLDRLLQENTP